MPLEEAMTKNIYEETKTNEFSPFTTSGCGEKMTSVSLLNLEYWISLIPMFVFRFGQFQISLRRVSVFTHVYQFSCLATPSKDQNQVLIIVSIREFRPHAIFDSRHPFATFGTVNVPQDASRIPASLRLCTTDDYKATVNLSCTIYG